MKNQNVYITDSSWFDQTALANPICTMDCNLHQLYPDLFEVTYDTRILVCKKPSHIEKSFSFYNDYRDVFGTEEMFTHSCEFPAKNVFLGGFNQEQFEQIAQRIKSTVEILYFFKCNTIKDLSSLQEFANLKCVHIFWNTCLTSLWNVKKNDFLKVLSFVNVTKLRSIETLTNSRIEYINFDSSDNSGNKKEMLFNKSIFNSMPDLKYLFLAYKQNNKT